MCHTTTVTRQCALGDLHCHDRLVQTEPDLHAKSPSAALRVWQCLGRCGKRSCQWFYSSPSWLGGTPSVLRRAGTCCRGFWLTVRHTWQRWWHGLRTPWGASSYSQRRLWGSLCWPGSSAASSTRLHDMRISERFCLTMLLEVVEEVGLALEPSHKVMRIDL